ncbi:MAG: hypothetical protein ACC660_03745, partial [Acidimicrobiales bacterium]
LLVNALDEYKWSSYAAYVGGVPAPSWLQTDIVLGWFPSPDSFRQFTGDSVEDRELADLCEGGGNQVLGSEAFAKQAVARSERSSISITTSRAGRRRWALDDIESVVATEFAVGRESLQSSIRGRQNVPRMAAILLCHLYGGATFAELAKRYGLGNSTSASTAVHRLKSLAERDHLVEIHLLAAGTTLQAA